MGFFPHFLKASLDLFRLAPISLDVPVVTNIDADNFPGPEKDAANLADDWAKVGGYFRRAMKTAAAEHGLSGL